jgi:hypothetical protein
MHRGTLLGVATVSVLTGALGLFLVAWSFAPPGAEARLVATLDPLATRDRERPALGRAGRDPAHAAARARVASPNPARGSAQLPAERDADKPMRMVAEQARAQNLDDAERAMLRRELREERLIDVNARLDAFAETEGWDPAMTDEVRDILIDTADHITRVLAQVDRREVEWDAVKVDLWAYREQQAQQVRRALGPNDFDHFVESMDFARFFGEAPVRGRVD